MEDLFHRREVSTRQALQQLRFSRRMIEEFFRPFFGGIQLDPNLAASSRMFEFVFRMMAEGDVAVPARGMGEIPKQLAAAHQRLDARCVRFGVLEGANVAASRLRPGYTALIAFPAERVVRRIDCAIGAARMNPRASSPATLSIRVLRQDSTILSTVRRRPSALPKSFSIANLATRGSASGGSCNTFAAIAEF